MDRTLINTSAPIQNTFTVDGVPTDATGNVLVTITRDDGTVLTTAATATKPPTTTGVYQFTLPPATHANLLDTLTVAWTGTVGGIVQTVTTTVEIVGGFVFSTAQGLKAISGSTAADIAAARTYAETELENALGFALVPRYRRDTLSGKGSGYPLRLKRPYVRTIRSASYTQAGVTRALTASDITGLAFDSTGTVSGYWWPYGRGNITVRYEHGLDTPPAGAARAALALATDFLGGDSSIDPRAESIVTVDGTIRLRTGGQFPAAGVDAWVLANRIPLVA